MEDLQNSSKLHLSELMFSIKEKGFDSVTKASYSDVVVATINLLCASTKALEGVPDKWIKLKECCIYIIDNWEKNDYDNVA